MKNQLDTIRRQLHKNGRMLKHIDRDLRRLETSMRYKIARTNIEWIRKTFGIDYTLYAIIGPGLAKPYIATSEERAVELAQIFEHIFLAGKKSRGGNDDTA